MDSIRKFIRGKKRKRAYISGEDGIDEVISILKDIKDACGCKYALACTVERRVEAVCVTGARVDFVDGMQIADVPRQLKCGYYLEDVQVNLTEGSITAFITPTAPRTLEFDPEKLTFRALDVDGAKAESEKTVLQTSKLLAGVDEPDVARLSKIIAAIQMFFDQHPTSHAGVNVHITRVGGVYEMMVEGVLCIPAIFLRALRVYKVDIAIDCERKNMMISIPSIQGNVL